MVFNLFFSIFKHLFFNFVVSLDNKKPKKYKWLSYIFSSSKKHRYHMVSPSPWPIAVSASLLILVLVFLNVINKHMSGWWLLISLLLLVSIVSCWFRDINRESTYMGYHTIKVQTMLRTGFILFLVSEVMVFFGFFWAYFHVALTPSIFVGNIWPPEGIVLYPFSEDALDTPVSYLGIFENHTYNSSMYEIINRCNIKNSKFSLFFIDELYFNNYPMFMDDNLPSLYNKKIFELIADYAEDGSLYDMNNFNSNDFLLSNLFSIINFESLIPVLETILSGANVETEGFYLSQMWRFCNNLELFDNALSDYQWSYYYKMTKKEIFMVKAVNIIWSVFNFVSDVDYTTVEKALERSCRDEDDRSFCHINVHDSSTLVNPFRIPFLNTLILLTSGCTLMWSHACLRLRSYFRSLLGLTLTIILALIFIFCQFYEYAISSYSIIDGIYGTVFYMLTGLHGFHVIIGTVFLSVCLVRMFFMEISSNNHFSYEAAIWYWHFVDVVWIFLYIFVYVWPTFFYFRGIHENSDINYEGWSFLYEYIFNCPIKYFKKKDSFLFNINFSINNTDLYIKNKIFAYIFDYFAAIDETTIMTYAKNYYNYSLEDIYEFIYNFNFLYETVIPEQKIYYNNINKSNPNKWTLHYF